MRNTLAPRCSGAIYRTTKYCFGDDKSELSEYAWYSENSGGKTHPVGTELPNAFGIYDMHGNVWEWCADWHKNDFYRETPYKNPIGPTSGWYSGRVLRGGSWLNGGVFLRSANRDWVVPDGWRGSRGFRCAVSKDIR